ncbi:hypothetical protein HKX48_008384 [Thoreauomyces humboldtii]|nr:hypothetical protein HKX48_008384 [Thoreauomyces humboldtii]
MPGRIGMPDPGTYLTKAAALQNQYQRDQAAKHAQLQQQLRQLEAEEAEMNRRRAEQTRALEIERKVLEEEEQDLLLADASALGIELRAMKGLSARLALLESQLERSDQAGMAAPAPQAAGQ